jgi:hypothetical protein
MKINLYRSRNRYILFPTATTTTATDDDDDDDNNNNTIYFFSFQCWEGKTRAADHKHHGILSLIPTQNVLIGSGILHCDVIYLRKFVT